MPTVTVGYFTACTHCGRRTDVVWAKPMHLCQVCGNAFCKNCGISYVCKSCLARQPADIQEKLIKKARSIPIGSAIGVSLILGGPILLIYLLMESQGSVSFLENNTMLLGVLGIAGLFFICCGGIKLQWGGHHKMLRAINLLYFGKDTKEFNFTGATTGGGFKQVPANLKPTINTTPGSFSTIPLFDLPSAPPAPSAPTNSQFCPLCGGQVRATICQGCGSKICPKCGHPDPDKSAKFCGSCGNVF